MDKNILHDITYGMYIVSSCYNGKDSGLVINTLCQVTSSDPTISICLNKDNYTNNVIKERKLFAVSILSNDTSSKTIGNFGYFSSLDKDKFSDVPYLTYDDIKVLNDNICGYLICEVVNIVDVGTHDIFIAKIKESKKLSDKVPMTYKYYHEVLKGKTPKNAPTYEEEKIKDQYKCSICGYVYDMDIPFEDLPDDFKCPICGAPKSMFK